ncbi:MAG: DUF1638 domain-containing protein [Deltaproteobacteria bacterium]|jgi:hypothetical protein|nr:DUF1638 domain-containing protein [Deltaproteobacteria bacterium]
MSLTNQKPLIIGCAILQEEFEAIFSPNFNLDTEIIWLKPGYHSRTDKLRDCLNSLVESICFERKKLTRIFFGQSCLIDLEQSFQKEFKVLNTRNCLTALVGEKRLKELESEATMVVTPSWIRNIFLSQDEEFPIWQEADFRMNFGRYNRLLVLDAGLSPLSDEEILTAFDITGLVIEALPLDLTYFKNLAVEFIKN